MACVRFVRAFGHKYDHHHHYRPCLSGCPSVPHLCLLRAFFSSSLLVRPRTQGDRSEMVMMGQLGRLVDGIKSKLRASGRRKAAEAAAAGYDKVEKTDSMRVEIRSRQARKLIAKNLDAADTVIARRGNKRFFLAF